MYWSCAALPRRGDVPTLLECARCEGLRTAEASRSRDRFLDGCCIPLLSVGKHVARSYQMKDQRRAVRFSCQMGVLSKRSIEGPCNAITAPSKTSAQSGGFVNMSTRACRLPVIGVRLFQDSTAMGSQTGSTTRKRLLKRSRNGRPYKSMKENHG